ncbi:MAG: hypothetical protein KF746_20200 [Chitinophagaceae bacterium]|nr:hypothetical protein [Chitinophagaceae bacterium]
MKMKNLKPPGSILPLSIITAFITIILVSSCKKDPAENSVIKNDIIEAAKKAGSMVLSGDVTIANDDNGIVLNYNKGSKLILVEKIQGAKSIDMSGIHSAEIITFEYGVILKDTDSKKVFFLINNDYESVHAFQSIQSFFAGNHQSTTVFGVTVVNAEKV